ncbi:histidine kinase [Scytonema hofmannii FACHB-248]|uniref:Histidine kinase n=1 Tax=Scytonema hofmannii FACHB-248 TaxID=1842502 RepID=A0ABR8GXB7_9CYAN|nr:MULTISPECIES: histidine kinase [Nostocales]MBD2608132.1 histidine kinase [Scytonema hofmannii FACHB-248]
MTGDKEAGEAGDAGEAGGDEANSSFFPMPNAPCPMPNAPCPNLHPLPVLLTNQV